MSFPLAALILWAAGFLGNAALLAVLFYRKRIRTIPWFTSWIVFNLLYTIVLFAAYATSSKQVYVVSYWVGGFLDLILQVAIVLEIATYVFRRGQTWVQTAKTRLVWAGILAAIAAATMGWTMVPVTNSAISAFEARVDLGCTIFITLLFTSVMVVSHQLGVSWRSLVLREGYGIAVWSVVTFVTDTFHAYWRTAGHFESLENLRVVVYLCALGYWAVTFWMPEALPLVPDALTQKSAMELRNALELRRSKVAR